MRYLSKGKVKPHSRISHSRVLKNGKIILVNFGMINAQLFRKKNLEFKF